MDKLYWKEIMFYSVLCEFMNCHIGIHTQLYTVKIRSWFLKHWWFEYFLLSAFLWKEVRVFRKQVKFMCTVWMICACVFVLYIFVFTLCLLIKLLKAMSILFSLLMISKLMAYIWTYIFIILYTFILWNILNKLHSRQESMYKN